MAHQTGTLTGNHIRSNGAPWVDRKVTVVPSAVVRDTAGNTLMSGSFETRTDADGSYTIPDVVATDSTGVNPSGVTYTVIVDVHDVLPVAGVHVLAGLTTLVSAGTPVAPSAPMYAEQVSRLEFNELAGHVDQLDVPVDLAGTAAAVVAGHSADTTSVHGIVDTALLETKVGAQVRADVARSEAISAAADDAASKANAAKAAAQVYTDTAKATALSYTDTAVSAESVARDAAIVLALQSLIGMAPAELDQWGDIVSAIQTDQAGLAAVVLMLANKQPLNLELSMLAALSTTTFGRNLLTIATDVMFRSAIGLGSAATQPSSAFDAAGSATAAVSGHVGAIDPHGDRAFASAVLAGHLSANDPHGDRAFASAALAGHLSADDPHGDRAWSLAQIGIAIADLIGTAPGTLDTLGDIANRLADDESVEAAMTAAIGARVVGPGSTVVDNSVPRFDTATGLLIQSSLITIDDNGRLILPDHVSSTGGFRFGADANLYRSAANTLKTDGSFVTGGGITAGGAVNVGGAIVANGSVTITASNGAFLVRTSALVTQTTFATRISTDTVDRFQVQADGTLKWGPGGSAAVDTNLYRTAAGQLRTDGAFVAGGIITAARPASDNVSFLARVTGDAVDRYTVSATGKQEWGSGAATRDVNLYRKAADVLATDDSLFLANQTTPPPTPVGGGTIYVQAGALKYIGSSGSVTVLGAA